MLTNNRRKTVNKIWFFTVETYQPEANDDFDGNVGAEEKQLSNTDCSVKTSFEIAEVLS